VQEMVYGQYTRKNGKPEVYNIKRYPAECVNPPDGMKSEDWIKNHLLQTPCK
jgi:branched-chain amino acid transport system substrate-binding protein